MFKKGGFVNKKISTRLWGVFSIKEGIVPSDFKFCDDPIAVGAIGEEQDLKDGVLEPVLERIKSYKCVRKSYLDCYGSTFKRKAQSPFVSVRGAFE